MVRIGSKFIGSSTVLTSTAMQQIVPSPPSNWSGKYNFYRFSFRNMSDCTVKINEGNPIFIKGGDGFNTDIYDSPIWSFVIIEAGIKFNWIAGY